ncbi:MAG: PrgI family protein [Nanoarchaeota archaeon]
MAYEIPQQLEYKEKIMFGLNFKQLAYLFIFAPILFVIFFKTAWHNAIKIFFMSIFGGLAIGFIFLDLDKHLQNWFYWYKSKKLELDHKLALFIPIKEVKDSLVITRDNRKLAIIKITPINFSIKHEESKNAISIAFQKFLNGLDFPIQIIMNTEHLDLRDYFAEVERKIKDSKQFRYLFEGYKRHLESITKEKDVMNRVFYLVLTERTDINIQLQICQTKLSNIGLKSLRLKDNELKELLRRFFLARRNHAK